MSSFWLYGWIYKCTIGVVFIREVYDRLYWISLWAIVMGQVLTSSLRVRFIGRLYWYYWRVSFICCASFYFSSQVYGSNLRIVFYSSNCLIMFTGQVCGSWLLLIFYEVKFYFDLTVDYFGLGLYSNLQVKFVWCLNGWSLWNMLTADFTGVISTHFTRLNFMSIFEFVFLVWVFSLIYG